MNLNVFSNRRWSCMTQFIILLTQQINLVASQFQSLPFRLESLVFQLSSARRLCSAQSTTLLKQTKAKGGFKCSWNTSEFATTISLQLNSCRRSSILFARQASRVLSMMHNSKQLMSSRNYTCKSLKRKSKSKNKSLQMKSKARSGQLDSLKVRKVGLEMVVAHIRKNLNMVKAWVIRKAVKGIGVAEEVNKQIKKIWMRMKKKNKRILKRQCKNRFVLNRREKNRQKKRNNLKRWKWKKPRWKFKEPSNKLNGIIQLIQKGMLIWKATQTVLSSL